MASEIALFNGTTGKSIKRATGTGIAHIADGVLSASNVVESEITTADNTTNDVTTSKHGFAPKAPNDATKYLDGTGAYTVPAGSGGGGGTTTSAVVMTRVAAQSISNATDTKIQWDTVVKNDQNLWSSGANTKFTVASAGYYQMCVTGLWASGFANYAQIWVNGAVKWYGQHAASDAEVTVCGTDYFAASDYVEFNVYQASGSSKNITARGGLTLLSAAFPSGAQAAGEGAYVSRTSNQSISNNTVTAISWDTETRDDNNYWTLSPNPTRLTVTRAGWYQISCVQEWDSNTTGGRAIDMTVNGGGRIFSNGADGSQGTLSRQAISGAYYLAAADYVECTAYQNSGGTRTLNPAYASIVKLSSPVVSQIQNARLTLTTAVPVTTSDVTAATNVYVTPYNGNVLTFYDSGTAWVNHTFSEITVALGTISNATNYDVFCWYNGTAVACLLGPAWSSGTSRGTGAGTTELTTQNGVNVNAVSISGACGAKACTYYGTLRTTATTTTEDSAAKRFLWNAYNRKLRNMKNAIEATDSWNYTTATFRQANANAANQLAFVVGLAEDVVSAKVHAVVGSTVSATATAGIGLDSTSTNSATVFGFNTNTVALASVAEYKAAIAVGYHYLAWLEYSQASGTTTWYGDAGNATAYQSGIIGEILN